MNASEHFNIARDRAAELGHLRQFYRLWCQMHMTFNDPTMDDDDKVQASQALVEQSKMLKEFYA